MCFTGEMSAGFAAVGLFSSWWIYTKTENMELASGVCISFVAGVFLFSTFSGFLR